MESERDKASLHKPDWSSLPQDPMTEILVRFPVKDLLQFKSVCKGWLRFISSPEFVKDHLRVSAKDCRLLLCNSLERQVKHFSVASLFDDPFTKPFYLDHPVEKPSPGGIPIVGSVNGLICFHNALKEGFVLWNPSTRKFKKVPLPKDDSGYMYGFGYDEVRDDYKIVGVDFRVRSATMYSLRSDYWRELHFQCRASWGQSAVLVNGKLHWAIGTPFSEYRDIISFDLVDENFGKVVLPSYEKSTKVLSLGILGSNLCMLCNYAINEKRVTRSDLWVMKKYGVKESWTKLYTIDYAVLIPYADNWIQNVTSPPICMSSKGESLFVNTTTLRIYNPEDKSFKAVINVNGHLRAELYIESLVCPFGTTLKAAKWSGE